MYGNKVLARDPSTHLFDEQIIPWTGRIKKSDRCAILKVDVKKVPIELLKLVCTNNARQ